MNAQSKAIKKNCLLPILSLKKRINMEATADASDVVEFIQL